MPMKQFAFMLSAVLIAAGLTVFVAVWAQGFGVPVGGGLFLAMLAALGVRLWLKR